MKNVSLFVKKHVWPHRHNRYQPSVLKLPVFFLMVVALLALQFAPAPAAKVLGASSSVDAAELIKLTNAQRQKHGLKSLKINAKLQKAAHAKAKDMLKRNYWAHYAPDGTAPWQFIEDSGYFYETAGENLAKNFSTSSGVMAGWMKSPGHRENILDASYKDIGIAVAKGNINGQTTSVTVAMYAARQPVGVTLLGTGSSETLPAQTGYSLANPLNPRKTLPRIIWIFAGISLLFAVLYAAQHLIIRQRRMRWDKKAHPHPMFQAAMFGGLTVLLLQSGLGMVG